MVRHILAVASVSLALAAPSALAGQIHNRDTSLDDVVARAELAVVVKLGDPASTKVEIPVPGKDRRTKKPCGTYTYGAWRVEVVEILGDKARAPVKVGGTIVVLPGNTPGLIRLSERYCTEGVSKSPIWGRFKGADTAAGSTRVALLRWEPGFGWVEAVAGSWVTPKSRDKVEALLKTSPRFSTGGDRQYEAMCVTDADCGLAPMKLGGTCGKCAGSKGQPATLAAIWRMHARCPEAKCAKPRTKKTPVCRKMRCRR